MRKGIATLLIIGIILIVIILLIIGLYNPIVCIQSQGLNLDCLRHSVFYSPFSECTLTNPC
jgi:hypothetical protein